MKKFCPDCRWFDGAAYPRPYSLCRHEEARMLEGGLYSPGLMRTEFHACGPEGKLFEPKPPRISLWNRLFHSAPAGQS